MSSYLNSEDKIIEVYNLVKSYKDVKAVDDISFYVKHGDLFAFLGPNGAGKSTTVDVICTFLKQDSGSAIINGKKLGVDDHAIHSDIGVVFQEGVLDVLLTVRENLKFRGEMYGLKGKKLDDAVKRVEKLTGLSDFLDRQYGKLSGGQKRRADIARALIHEPKILFLDEPTTGLDPQTRQSIWESIKELQKKTNITVFFSTHYMEEVLVANYVVIIDKGKIVANGTPTELKAKYTSDILRLYPVSGSELCEFLNSINIKYVYAKDRVDVHIADTFQSLPIIEKCKKYLNGFEVLNGTMDDVFISITGRDIRE